MVFSVTDNASNMAGSRKEVVAAQLDTIAKLEKEESSPEREGKLEILRDNLLVDAFGCSAHLLNLWYAILPSLLFFFSFPPFPTSGQDLTDAGLISKVTTICKYSKTEGPKAWLEHVKARRPPLPAETRCYSTTEMLEWFVCPKRNTGWNLILVLLLQVS